MNEQNQLNELLSNLDIISDINISFLSSFYSIICAVFSAYLVKYAYVKYGRSMNNRETFSDVFVLLSAITCIIIIIVKYSLALSLGLVGALSIVRFRAAIKEPEELVYLFLIIGLGLSYGANQFIPGFILLVTSLLVIYFNKYRDRSDSNNKLKGTILVVNGPSNEVNEWKNKSLKELKNYSSDLILKEIESKNNQMKIVFRFVGISSPDKLLDDFNNYTDNQNIQFNFISDIVIPE